jgi:outer membrane autotransporter protein
LNQPFDASGVSVTANAGYYIPLANNWFAEPSVGMVWSRTSVDPLTIPGGPITVPGIGAVVIPPGTATFDDVKSLLGRAGVRFGYNFTTPTLALQPYAVVSVWHEFADAATATLSCAACAGINLNLSSSRVGTYGQYSLGLAGQILNTGWLGYGRVDYRNGDNIEGWSVTAGLRYQWQEAGNPGVVKAKY